MRKRITEKLILSLRPEKTLEVSDDVCQGLVLIAAPAGSNTWYFKWTDHGKRKRPPWPPPVQPKGRRYVDR